MNAFQCKWSYACCMQYTSAEGQMLALRGSVVCFTEVKCTCFSFLWQCAELWMDSRSHTDYIPYILVLSMPFSPFHLFFPQTFSLNSFDGGISWIPDFVEWAFPSVTFTRGTLAAVKLLFYNTCHPRCSHHLISQTGFAISPWNKYNIVSSPRLPLPTLLL